MLFATEVPILISERNTLPLLVQTHYSTNFLERTDRVKSDGTVIGRHEIHKGRSLWLATGKKSGNGKKMATS